MNRMYLALLRGINVGGNNLMKMADVKACLEQSGFDRVTTFIASGNVLVNTSERSPKRITSTIESALSRRFGCDLKAVVLSHEQLEHAVGHVPPGFGKNPDTFRYDVVFLRPPVKPTDVMNVIPLKEGVDRAWAGKDVVYCSRLAAKAAQSRLSKMVSLPIYKELTVRNWNTTTKLLELMNRG